jgi:hypothetical protein
MKAAPDPFSGAVAALLERVAVTPVRRFVRPSVAVRLP